MAVVENKHTPAANDLVVELPAIDNIEIADPKAITPRFLYVADTASVSYVEGLVKDFRRAITIRNRWWKIAILTICL